MSVMERLFVISRNDVQRVDCRQPSATPSRSSDGSPAPRSGRASSWIPKDALTPRAPRELARWSRSPCHASRRARSRQEEPVLLPEPGVDRGRAERMQDRAPTYSCIIRRSASMSAEPPRNDSTTAPTPASSAPRRWSLASTWAISISCSKPTLRARCRRSSSGWDDGPPRGYDRKHDFPLPRTRCNAPGDCPRRAC